MFLKASLCKLKYGFKFKWINEVAANQIFMQHVMYKQKSEFSNHYIIATFHIPISTPVVPGLVRKPFEAYSQ